MNYMQEIKAFYDWLITNPIPADAQALWHALMHINNKCAWQEEFTVANTTLLSILGFSRQQLDRMRNVLIQTGRIEYKKRDGRQAGIYKINKFVSHNVIQPVTQVETQMETQPVTQVETQTGHNCGTLNKLNINETKLDCINNPPIIPPTAKRRKREKPEQDKPEKIKFAEFVAMTNDEYEKLLATYGKENTQRMIEVLDNYKGANGKKYASDYRAILNWVVNRVMEEQRKGGRSSGGSVKRIGCDDDFEDLTWRPVSGQKDAAGT